MIWAQDANLLNTLEGTTTDSYNTLVAAIISANNGVVKDSPNYLDGDSKTYTLTAADFAAGGTADYWGAIAFAEYLNFIRYGGSNKWALPAIGDTSVGYNQTGNAFGELYYNEGGGTPANPPANTSLFANVQFTTTGIVGYGFGSEYSLNANYAWFFSSGYGCQFFTGNSYQNYVWPLRPAPNQYTVK